MSTMVISRRGQLLESSVRAGLQQHDAWTVRESHLIHWRASIVVLEGADRFLGSQGLQVAGTVAVLPNTSSTSLAASGS